MVTKLCAGLVAMAAVAASGLALSGPGQACCAPGSECCYAGSLCCAGEPTGQPAADGPGQEAVKPVELPKAPAKAGCKCCAGDDAKAEKPAKAAERKPGSVTEGAADKAKEAAADLAKGPIDIAAAAEGTDAKVEAFVAEKEKLVEDKRQRMVGSLVQIIQNNPYYRGKASVLFRLAELEWESARYHYFLQRKKWEKEYEAFLDGTVKVQPPEPKPDYSQALSYYKQILQEFPQYDRLDEVMYYLGKGLVTASKAKQGAS
ncbi:MAG: hypothetical protein ABGY75_08275, partial [Gemmataceae bacterium]